MKRVRGRGSTFALKIFTESLLLLLVTLLFILVVELLLLLLVLEVIEEAGATMTGILVLVDVRMIMG